MQNDILHSMRKANAKEIDKILDAAMERRRQLFPDWEIIYYARPKRTPQEGELEFAELTGWVETN